MICIYVQILISTSFGIFAEEKTNQKPHTINVLGYNFHHTTKLHVEYKKLKKKNNNKSDIIATI